jgi:hypothetical protein
MKVPWFNQIASSTVNKEKPSDTWKEWEGLSQNSHVNHQFPGVKHQTGKINNSRMK